MEFLSNCKKKQYLKYLFQAAEETLSHYIKKKKKHKRKPQTITKKTRTTTPPTKTQ